MSEGHLIWGGADQSSQSVTSVHGRTAEADVERRRRRRRGKWWTGGKLFDTFFNGTGWKLAGAGDMWMRFIQARPPPPRPPTFTNNCRNQELSLSRLEIKSHKETQPDRPREIWSRNGWGVIIMGPNQLLDQPSKLKVDNESHGASWMKSSSSSYN